MIVILTGAKKNIGDFLIGYRAKQLLRKYVDEDITEIDRFEKLDDELDVINSARCLILCGGPAYSSNIYKGIYPLVDDISKIKVPIVPFGLGWNGQPFKHPDRFEFMPESKKFVTEIHKIIQYSSCRDQITKIILQNHGIKNVIMTGCPVWYDLDSIGKKFKVHPRIKKIVITTPANPRLILQVIKLLLLVRKKFPDVIIYFSFHRGILPDKHTGVRSSLVFITMSLIAKLIGTKVTDVAYDLEKIDFYQYCDFHIGYRVHAHLYFLSKRLPSILINEDGRGQGMVETMNLPVFNVDEDNLLNKISNQLDKYIRSGFTEFNNIAAFIDEKLENSMVIFLKSLKNVQLFKKSGIKTC